MQRWVRDAHLLLGLFVAATVVMYGVSSAQMAHREWLPWRASVLERSLTLESGMTDGRAVARALMEHHGLWGDLAQTGQSQSQGEIRVRIYRPGTEIEAAYRTVTGETRLKIERAPFAGMLVALHHAHGWSHESMSVNLWGALVGLVSIGLMVLGGTGVYLWFKIHKERAVGGVILAVSLGFSLSLIALIRAAG
jgi:hypothetical protein